MIPAHPVHLDLRPGWDVEAMMLAAKAGRPKSSPYTKPSRAKPGKSRAGKAPRGGFRK